MDFPYYQPSSIYGSGSPYPVWDAILTCIYYIYLAIILVLMVFSAHAYMLVVLGRRLRRRRLRQMRTQPLPEDLPSVSVQVPIYNEGQLAVQAVEAAARIKYPADKLQIVILDGSTDSTPEIVGPVIERLRREGRNIIHHRRDNSIGYKAGALADGVRMAEAELIAIFDADFVPARSFLMRVVHHFADPRIGCVQTRWGHRNAGHSLLTLDQSMILDSFYGTELPVRSGYNFSSVFTGTCGVWRKACVEDAGGWQWDTLVEDMDLSYAAQVRGWRIIYDQGVVTPGELPESMSAFLRQQHRWTMGHAQVCRKHLGAVLRAKWPWWKKLEAVVQLFRWATYPGVLLMAALMMPALIINPQLKQMLPLEAAFGLIMFLLASGGATIFYISGQMALHPRTWWWKALYLPTLVSLSLALAPTCCLAIIRGLIGWKEPFRKTPRAGEKAQRLLVSEVCLIAVNALLGLYLLTSSVVTFVAAFRIEAWSFLITGVALLVFSAGLIYAAVGGIRNALVAAARSHASAQATTAA